MTGKRERFEPLRPIHSSVRWHTAIGWALMGGATVFSAYWPAPDPGFRYGLLWATFATSLAAAALIAWWPAATRSPASFAAITAFAGLLAVLSVLATGGAVSHMLPLSLAVAVAGAALLPGWGAAAVTVLAMLHASAPLLVRVVERHQAREAVLLLVATPVVASFVHAIKTLTVRESAERRFLNSFVQASQLSTTLDLDETLESTADGIKQAIDAHHAVLYLVDRERGELVPRVVRTTPDVAEPGEETAIRALRPRLGEGLTGHVAATGQPLITGDAQKHPVAQRIPGLPRRDISMIVVPLRVGDRVIGVLRVSRLGRDQFRAEDVKIATLFANQAAVAIENARLYAEARHLSITDGLTGLYNGRHLRDRLAAELARARRYGHPLSVVMIDSDSLKAVNDRFGHHEGDRLLIRLSHKIRMHMREADLAFRYAGDEFVLVLPETDADGARVLVERIRSEVEAEPLRVDGEPVGVTISAGVAAFPTHGATAEDLMRAADAAMYGAKSSGKNRVLVASGSSEAPA